VRHGEFQGQGKSYQWPKESKTNLAKGALHGDQKGVCANYQWKKDLEVVTYSDSDQKISWIPSKGPLTMEHF
jgi:hypothetical protein